MGNMGDTVIVRELSPWQVISSKISRSEHDVVRSILGDDIIDEVEMLHREVCSLLDIWRDYRSLISAEEQELENNKRFGIPYEMNVLNSRI